MAASKPFNAITECPVARAWKGYRWLEAMVLALLVPAILLPAPARLDAASRPSTGDETTAPVGPVELTPSPYGMHGPRAPTSLICDPTAWPLPVDGGLCDAARKLAVRLGGSLETRDHDEARDASLTRASFLVTKALHEAGVTDPHVLARRVRAPTYNALFTRIETTIADWSATVSHIGMALSPGNPDMPSAVVLGARRLVHIEPFPSSVEVGENVSIRGRLGAGCSAPAAWLGVDNGPVKALTVDVMDRAFSLETGSLPLGRHFVEILVDAGEGPEVALLAPVRAGSVEEDAQARVFSFDSRGEPLALLHQAIADNRAARGLQPVVRDAVLDGLASRRAEAMGARGRPVHGSAPDEQAAASLAEQGYPFAWAAENLATGPSVEAAFSGLLDSPAHRRILEHPRTQQVGVGIHEDGSRVWLAVIAAEPMNARAAVSSATAARVVQNRLIHRAEDALRIARHRVGLALPPRDPALDELALDLAEHLAARDVPSDADAQRNTRQLAMNSDHHAVAVSVDIVVGGRPEDVEKAPAAGEDDCDRIGLGIASAPSIRFGGERLWLVSICMHRRGP